MTTTENRPTAVDLGDITLAAEVVVAAGYASQRLVQRKLRVSWDDAGDILTTLEWCGVVGPPDDEGTYPVLAVEDDLADLLARLQEPLVEPDDDTVEEAAQEVVEPVRVSLEKPTHQPAVVDVLEAEEDPPGDELELRQAAEVERYDATPTPRQQMARMWARVADEPAVLRTRAVTRQAPKAGARLVIWTPRGAVRVVAMYVAYLRDAETLRLLAHHEQQGLGLEYAKVARARQDKNVAGRQWLHGLIAVVLALVGLAWWAPQVFAGILAATAFLIVLLVGRSVCRDPKELAGMTVAALALGGLAWWQGPHLAALIPQPPGWVWWVLAGGAVVVFGVLGRKEDQHLVELPARMGSTKPPTITAPMVIGALVALGNSKMKDPDDVRVLMDPHQAGDGYQIDLELPASVTAGFVMENREKLAAAMRRNLGTVWPQVGLAHPGHLSLYVSNTPVNESEQEPWPLLSSGPIDIFAPQPVFTDQLGKWVYLTLAYASWVIGAVPRMGKTFTVRELLLVYGMDLRVKVIALDGKGTGDLASLAPFAHAHVRGARVDKPENIETVRAIVSWLLKEMGRRADVIADLPFEEVPDSKVTSELINARPELDLGPIVLGIDETQSFFSYGFRGNKEHKAIREEIRDGVIELMRMGPALGIWVIMATQTVRDSTIPSEAQAVAVYRWALKLEGWEPNDKVLGTGAFKSGIDATMFGFEEKGIGWLKGEGAKPLITRSVVGLNAVVSRTLALKIRAWRTAKGLLTGEAGGDPGIVDAEVVIDIAQDVEQVMRGHQRGRAQHVELVGWLKDLRADNYADLDVEELSARLRGAGIPIRQVRIDGINRKGVRLSDLQVSATDDGGDEGDAADA